MTTWHVEYYDVYEQWAEDKSEPFREAVRDEIARWISNGPPIAYSEYDEDLDIYTVAVPGSPFEIDYQHFESTGPPTIVVLLIR